MAGRNLARRLRPHLRLRRDHAHADPGQGQNPHRAFAPLVHADRKVICPNHVLGYDLPAGVDLPEFEGRLTRARRCEIFPVECVARGYLAGSGWEEYREHGPSAATPCRRACANRTACPSRSSPPRARTTTATTKTSRRSRGPRAARRRALRGTARPDARSLHLGRRLRRAARHHPRRHQARVRPRSAAPAASCSPTKSSRPTAPASGPPTPISPAARSPASTSNTCAITSRPSRPGTRPRPARICPRSGPQHPRQISRSAGAVDEVNYSRR